MPKKVWPKSGDEVQEWEVILYAFIALKALFPLVQGRSRKRGRDEQVDLDVHNNLTGLFVKTQEWWKDIAGALSTHPLTRDKKNLTQYEALYSWWIKYRNCNKTKFRGNILRDTWCVQRWKAYLSDDEARSVLEAHYESAVKRKRAAEALTNAGDTDGELAVIVPAVVLDVVPAVAVPGASTAQLESRKELMAELKEELKKEKELMSGSRSGKQDFHMLYNTDKDDNLTQFNPASILEVMKEKCSNLHDIVATFVTKPSDNRNKLKTPQQKMLQGFLIFSQMLRVSSERAVPVVALFMSIVFFACTMHRELMNEKAALGSCTTMKTLNTFLDIRKAVQSSDEVLSTLYPLSMFLLLVYDNYVKASRRIKHQRFGRKNKMVSGTMRGAGCVLIPPGLDFHAAAPYNLETVTLEQVLGYVSAGVVEQAWSESLERWVQVAMVKANIQGVKYPPPRNPPSLPTLNMYTLEFTNDDSGTIAGNRNILSTFQNQFKLHSESSEERRSTGFVVGDQLTYDQMQKYKLYYSLLYGVQSWIYPIPGDFHFYWHVLESAFFVYWDGGLATISKHLKRNGVKKEASQGNFELHSEFLIAVGEGAMDALLDMWQFATQYKFSTDTTDGIKAFLTWVEDCSAQDTVFAYWADFIFVFCHTYLESRRAVRVGDIESLLYVYRRMLVIFHVAGKSKCARLVVEHLLDIGLFHAWLTTIMKATRTVKLSNRKYVNVALDRWMEFQNGLMKKLHTEIASLETMQRVSANIDLIREVRHRFLSMRGRKRSNTHSRVRLDSDRAKVKDLFLTFGVFQVDESREGEVYTVFEESTWKQPLLRISEAEAKHQPELQKLFGKVVAERLEAEMSIR